MKKVTLSLLLFGWASLTSVNMYSAQILLSGHIYESQGNKPISVSIEFKDKNGKKISTKSNSISGEYQQILESNTNYSVVLNSNEILRREYKIHTLDTNDYAEQKLNFSVFKPIIGSKILEANIFSNGTSNLTDNGKEQLEELQSMLRFNRNLNVEVRISANNSNLIQSRIDVINNIIGGWKRENPRIKVIKFDNNNFDFDVNISDIKSYLD